MSARAGRREQSRDPAARRHTLLRAARELVFERGYHGTTIEQIAKRAGYSKRTVYLDFRNKDELCISICAEGLELLLAELSRVPIDELPLDACIDRYLEVYVAFSRQRTAYFRLIFSEATPQMVKRCSPAVRARIRDLEKQCLGGVVSWAERAISESCMPPIDPWDAAAMFVGAATGILLLSVGGSQTIFSHERLRTVVHSAVWTLWGGLRAAAETARPSRKAMR